MFYYSRFIYLLRVLLGFDLYKRNWINLRDTKLPSLIIIYPFWYLLQVICAILNLFLIGELIYVIVLITHKHHRKLHLEEEQILATHYSNFNWKGIRIVEHSWLAKIGQKYTKSTKMGLCVSYSLHFSCPLHHKEHKTWLLHEAAHHIQYQQRGIIYIFEALIAQRFSGYKYLLTGWENFALREFNPEQQAEILSRENWSEPILI